MKFQKQLNVALGFLIAMGGHYYLASSVVRHETTPLFFAFAAAAIGYFMLQKNTVSWQWILAIGFCVRLLFIGYEPLLSPDAYRFLWDGTLQLKGINPYLFAPKGIYSPELFPSATFLFEHMGELHQSYPSIYPPVSQWLYKWAATMGGSSVFQQLLYLRLGVLMLEVGLFFLGISILNHLKRPLEEIGWYYLNPLVVVELTGNLHGEGVMLFFWAASLFLLFKKRVFWSGVFLSLAIGTKLIPLLFVPLLFIYLNKKDFSLLLLGLLPTVGLLWLPFWNPALFTTYSATLSLWLNRFEFNASIYYLVRWLGWQTVGYNIIGLWGTVLPFLFGGGLLYYCIRAKQTIRENLSHALLLILSIYFLLATTVHPWYLISILFFACFSSYRYPMVWTILAFSSYHAYGVQTVTENPVVLWMAYTMVGIVFFYEYKKKNIRAFSKN